MSLDVDDADCMPDPIIACIDPRREDIDSAALGAQLARLTGAPLILAAAYPTAPAIDLQYPDYVHALRVEAEQALDGVTSRLHDAPGAALDLTTATVSTAGSTARALHELAEREQAGLLVVGSSARGPLGRVSPGAVTDRLLHGAPCPIAVAPAGFSLHTAARPRLIGAAFVDSPDGHAALTTARRLAERAGARVRVLTVMEPLEWLTAAAPTGGGLVDAERVRREAAERVLDRALDAVPDHRSAGGEVLSGHPVQALTAASADLDLLVCGSRGHGPVQTLLLGGTAHALVRRAACPVLVVPPAIPRPVVDVIETTHLGR